MSDKTYGKILSDFPELFLQTPCVMCNEPGLKMLSDDFDSLNKTCFFELGCTKCGALYDVEGQYETVAPTLQELSVEELVEVLTKRGYRVTLEKASGEDAGQVV